MNRVITRFLRPKALTTLVLVILSALLMSSCSIGPVDFGGSSAATPNPSQGSTAGTPTSGGGAAAVQMSPTPSGRSIAGRVVDLYSGQPVGNADVTAAGIMTETTTDGVFSFDAVPPGEKLIAHAEGYAPGEVDTGTLSDLVVKLRPNTVSGRVTDATTGKPLASVLVKLVMPEAPISSTGTITNNTEITATAVATTTQTTGSLGYGKGVAAPLLLASATPSAADPVSVTSAITSTSIPTTPTATPTPKLIPPTGSGFVAVYTDENGSYFFKDVPADASLTFKMPGYKLTKQTLAEGAHKDVALEQFKVQAAYITAPVASTKSLYNPLVDFISNSKFNAVVLNVQNDNSEWVFDTKNPDAIAANNTDVFLPNIADTVKGLKAKGLYTIARVVTFQQPTMAKARLDMAVKSSVTGKAWLGGQLNQQAWIDASNPKAQDYVLAMTKEVLALGFDEIQYDYVRFPSDPAPREPGKAVFLNAATNESKAIALEGFLKRAHELIEPTDAFMSIDVFGYTLWPDTTDGPVNGVIGQVFEHLVDHTDYMAPMIYPSHFSPGEAGCPKPAACAYKLIHKAGEYAIERFAGKRAKYRPWLEDFDWAPNFDYTSPGTTKVAEQIQAAAETGAWGWMMWDPANDYEPRATFKK